LNKKQHIDTWLNQSLENVPKQDFGAMWDRIDKKLDANKSKKRIVIWWSSAVVFLLFGILSSCLYQLKQETTLKNKSTTEAISKITPKLDSKIEIEKEFLKSSNQNNRIQELVKIDSKKISDSQKRILINNKANKQKLNKQKFDRQKTATAIIDNKYSTILENINIKNKFSLNQTTITELAIQNYSLFNEIPIPMLIILRKPRPFNNEVLTFGVYAGAAPFNTNTKISTNGMAYVHKDYLSIRKSSETPIATINYGAYIRKNLRHFNIQLGVNYFQRDIQQNYNYKISEIPITNAFNTQKDANGKFPLDLYTPYLPVSNPRMVNYQGTYKTTFLEIPLNIGYLIACPKKITLIPSIGVGINFAQLNSNNMSIDYQNLRLNNFGNIFSSTKTQNYSFNASLSLEKPIYNQLSLTIQPFYQQFMLSKVSVVSEKSFGYGVNAGLNFKFIK